MKCKDATWTYSPSTDTCFKVFEVRRAKTFDEAVNVCRWANSRLAEIPNKKVNNLVALLTRDIDAWLGLVKFNGVWTWKASTTVLTYSKWAPGEPNGKNNAHCGKMWSTRGMGLWDDDNCGKRLSHFVCEQGESERTNKLCLPRSLISPLS